MYNLYGNKTAAEAAHNITTAHKFTADRLAEVDTAKKIYDLAYADEIKTVRDNVSYEYFTFVIEKSINWLYSLKNKEVDENKTCEEHDHFNFLTSSIKKYITGNDVDVTITSIGYVRPGLRAWDVLFTATANDITQNYELEIPNLAGLDHENFDIMRGEMCLRRNKPHCYDFIKSSYDENDIKAAFRNDMGLGELLND